MQKVYLIQRIESKEIILAFRESLDAQLVFNVKNCDELRPAEITAGYRNYRIIEIEVK